MHPTENLEETGWEIAERRNNRSIFARFQLKDSPKREICVGTYHNPCLYGSFEKVKGVSIHTSWLFQHFEKFSKGTPRILAGDFNITPTNSEVFNYITSEDEQLREKVLKEDLKLEEGKTSAYEDWSPKFETMTSSYHQYYQKKSKKEGKEISVPPTTYASAHTLEEGDKNFCDILDYIFVSRNDFEVEGIYEHHSREMLEMEKIACPSENEPSDHFMLAVEISLI